MVFLMRAKNRRWLLVTENTIFKKSEAKLMFAHKRQYTEHWTAPLKTANDLNETLPGNLDDKLLFFTFSSVLELE